MNYQIIWSPGRIYEVVDDARRAVASITLEGDAFFSHARSATMIVGKRRWAAEIKGVFRRRFVLKDDKGQVTTAENDALYSADLGMQIDGRLYRFQNRGWMINWLTISDDSNRDIIEIHNQWIRLSSDVGHVSFMLGPPDETQLLLALFGFYQLRVLEYASAS